MKYIHPLACCQKSDLVSEALLSAKTESHRMGQTKQKSKKRKRKRKSRLGIDHLIWSSSSCRCCGSSGGCTRFSTWVLSSSLGTKRWLLKDCSCVISASLVRSTDAPVWVFTNHVSVHYSWSTSEALRRELCKTLSTGEASCTGRESFGVTIKWFDSMSSAQWKR